MSEQINDTNKNKTKNNSKAIEKTQVADINRSIYDIRNDGADDYRFDAGLSAEIVERLSREKNDPAWMREFRLRSLEIYNNMEVPDWGPDISGLDMEHIATYVRPKNNKMQNKWEDVPEEIRSTFDRLGLAGVGAGTDNRFRPHDLFDRH
jgi:Fe-S cluster assembly protein SufB